ncbi:unnamed protein product [Psylliodes chrysocephalus]|uniref:Uncharacterized protein n=1 Tax=Psylliodes chrysocephalus TaxID=3402493 RepID=A0A9P0CYT9_9CUCU|nr:unnamed protein product [Psylliodes chrysocephala]
MPPNLEVQNPEEEEEEVEVNNQITIVLTPISDYSSSSSEINDTNLSDESISTIDVPLPEDPAPYLLEQTFKDFLYLSIYTPNLRELILDGSAVSSLRDLGGGLKNLKILKVNRCGLTCIDGVFSIEQLEELHAADNEIATLAPCAFLTNLRVLDVRRNLLSMENVPYLSFCENIEELYIEGNPGIMSRFLVELLRQRLSNIKILDGMLLTDIINDVNGGNDNNYVVVQNSLNRNISNRQQNLNFTVDFPPRVVLQRYFYNE